MRQGTTRGTLADRGNDLYETPAAAIRVLIRTVDLPGVVWEPAAGRGAISREIEATGRRVVKSDLAAYPGADDGIQSGVDFLLEREPPPGVEAIVTNPPYKLGDDFVRHGLRLGLPVYALLRLAYLEGAARSDLIDGHLWRIWVGIERLPKMNREGWTGAKLGQETQQFAWFLFEPWTRLASPIEMERISWRA
jgi:hypothetical protein